MIIINACLRRQTFNWKISYLLKKAWSLMDAFGVYTISHTLRQGNQVANQLSK